MRDSAHKVGTAFTAPEANDPQDRADTVLQASRPALQRLKIRIAISGVTPDIGTRCPDFAFAILVEHRADTFDLFSGRQVHVVDQGADIL
ncbi:MAG: hypothetical protein Q4P24_08785 [Rhodobacterales bacterium]|nr:hypothetical protein [Rhodobacterales bacterium]